MFKIYYLCIKYEYFLSTILEENSYKLFIPIDVMSDVKQCFFFLCRKQQVVSNITLIVQDKIVKTNM